MGIGWMVIIGFAGVITFFFLLGKLTWGTGADLVDWDPAGRQEEKLALEEEDAADLLALTNRRRRAAGRQELGELDVLQEIARRRVRHGPELPGPGDARREDRDR